MLKEGTTNSHLISFWSEFKLHFLLLGTVCEKYENFGIGQTFEKITSGAFRKEEWGDWAIRSSHWYSSVFVVDHLQEEGLRIFKRVLSVGLIFPLHIQITNMQIQIYKYKYKYSKSDKQIQILDGLRMSRPSHSSSSHSTFSLQTSNRFRRESASSGYWPSLQQNTLWKHSGSIMCDILALQCWKLCT